MDVWTQFAASPRGIVKVAEDAEAKGWDGLSVVDSQNLSGDPFVALAMAGAVTERIGLATAVSNPITRLPAAAAAGIASVDVVSRGRAIAVMPTASAAIDINSISAGPMEPCSQSSSTQSKPAWPTISTICGEGNMIDTPKAGSPRAIFSFIRFRITIC